jgi:hypothetical protein
MTKSMNNERKITFGRRKGGKPAKTRGPKDKRVSKYRSQGRV